MLSAMKNAAISIEKNIPLPVAKKGRTAKYPWGQLEIGDSFLVNASTRSMSVQASAAGKRFERSFSCRTVDGGVRVWRTA
jgi:hypothetical protein